jgi:tetratricopeptide (TPR) repeat protein
MRSAPTPVLRAARPRLLRAARAACLASAIAIGLAASPSSARAEDARAVELARSLYEAGAQAYAVGKYAAAIKAFEEALRLAPRPSIVYSLAQAHRRQYVLTKKPENLRAAIALFREYTSKVEQGGRLDDAAEALAQLEPLAQRLDAEAPSSGSPSPGASSPGAPSSSAPSSSAPSSSAPASSQLAQLMVSTSIAGATVSLDGGAPTPAPYIQDVQPGRRKLKVMAPGHFDYERELDVKPGAVVPLLDIPLREKPARLSLDCKPGADVSIDGTPVATTPLFRPIELSGGRHFLAITKVGHKPFSQEIEVKRGETRSIQVKLSTTGQRIASYTFLIAGGVTSLAGAVTGLFALGEEERAMELFKESKTRNLKEPERVEYNAALDKRDEIRNGAASLLGAGALFGAGGLLLYVFDQPPPVTPPVHSDDSGKKPAPEVPSLDVTGGVVWVPGYMGGSIVGRF